MSAKQPRRVRTLPLRTYAPRYGELVQYVPLQVLRISSACGSRVVTEWRSAGAVSTTPTQ